MDPKLLFVLLVQCISVFVSARELPFASSIAPAALHVTRLLLAHSTMHPGSQPEARYKRAAPRACSEIVNCGATMTVIDVCTAMRSTVVLRCIRGTPDTTLRYFITVLHAGSLSHNNKHMHRCPSSRWFAFHMLRAVGNP